MLLAPFVLAAVAALLPALVTVVVLWLVSRRWAIAWRAGLLVCITALAILSLVLIGPPRVQTDWRGGTVLTYELELDGADRVGLGEGGLNERAMVDAVEQRLRDLAGGAAEARFVSDQRLEVRVPGAEGDAEKTLARLATVGRLEFRILANERDHAPLIPLAWKSEAGLESGAGTYSVRDNGTERGRWVRVPRIANAGGRGPLRIDIGSAIARDATSGKRIVLTDALHEDPYLERSGPDDVDVLVFTDDGVDLGGEYLASISAGYDQALQPSVYFSLNAMGGQLIRKLTSENLPDDRTGHARQLGVILDDRLLTAPRIMSTIGQQGQITGQFTRDEVELLVGVLRAGSLPYGLNSTPVSIQEIPPAAIMGLSPIVVAGGSWMACLALGLALVFWLRPAGWSGLVAEGLHLLLLLAMYGVWFSRISAVEICLLPWLLIVSLVFNIPLLVAANRPTPPTGHGMGKPAGGSVGIRARHWLMALAGHAVLLTLGLLVLGITPLSRMLVLSSATAIFSSVAGPVLLLGLVHYAHVQRPVVAELVRAE